jgi:hypothetical protein
VILIALMAGDAFGQPEEIEERSELELRPEDTLDILMTAIPVGADGERDILHRPDGSAVIGGWVVGWML